MNQIFTLQMQSEDDGSVSWSLNDAQDVTGLLPTITRPVRIQGRGIETFILPESDDATRFFNNLLLDRGVDYESRRMILIDLIS